jgi:hypothetical protein
MTTTFILTLVAFFGLAVIGMPVAFAMFVASVGYLVATGRDIGLFGEQILNGLYDSFVLLAVPLFIRSTSWSASSSRACRARRSPMRPGPASSSPR